MKPIQFGLHHYKNRSLPASAQSLINWFPEVLGVDAKSQAILHACPGTSLFVDLAGGACRGAHVFNGVPYVVSGTTLFSIAANGAKTSIGTIDGAGRVGMASSDTQLVIATGAKGYTYDGGLAEITDVDWNSSSTVSYLDGYFIWPKDGTGDWFISDLLSGGVYDSTEYGTTYSNPDNTKTVVPFNREAWIFGSASIVINWNRGDADFPFVRNAYIEGSGLGATHSVAVGNGYLCWLGSDWEVYKAVGYQAVPISDSTIEHEFQSYNTKDDAFAFIYHEEGHTFYQLTFPAANKTWVCDLTNGLWHERAYRNTSTNKFERHRANAYFYAYNKHFVCDYANGKVYQWSLDVYTDNGDPLVVECTFPPVHNNGERVFNAELFLDFESGVGLVSGQGSDPQAMLTWSDDGRTYTQSGRTTDIGSIGAYKNRAVYRRLGMYYTRFYRVRVADPVKRTLIGAFIR